MYSSVNNKYPSFIYKISNLNKIKPLRNKIS